MDEFQNNQRIVLTSKNIDQLKIQAIENIEVGEMYEAADKIDQIVGIAEGAKYQVASTKQVTDK